MSFDRPTLVRRGSPDPHSRVLATLVGLVEPIVAAVPQPVTLGVLVVAVLNRVFAAGTPQNLALLVPGAAYTTVTVRLKRGGGHFFRQQQSTRDGPIGKNADKSCQLQV